MAVLEIFFVDLTKPPPPPQEDTDSLTAEASKLQHSIRRLREWKQAPRPSTRLLPPPTTATGT
jgi:hypothetical protein